MLFLTAEIAFAQIKLGTVIKYLEKVVDYNTISDADFENLIITSQHLSKQSGVQHIYLKQTLGGIEVNGTNSSIHLKNGEAFKFNQGFISLANNKVAQAKLTAKAAIERCRRIELSTTSKPVCCRKRNWDK